ncbi:hypothetical protein BAE36_05060 [Rhizobium leguminosarum bv. trifolii]|jgi:hypothetical protein|nr:hypothetical protein BAE36_05060 [Rhizobium leguminosarum bv. trifolii]
MDAVVFLEPFRRDAHFLIEVAGRAKRTRRCWRTSGFFRFLPVANAMAGELPTRPVRFLILLFSTGATTMGRPPLEANLSSMNIRVCCA